jgi:hypothetical protein
LPQVVLRQLDSIGRLFGRRRRLQCVVPGEEHESARHEQQERLAQPSVQ